MKTLLTRAELAARWSVDVKTVANWENEGVIQRVKGIPAPRYKLEDIEKLEGITDNRKFSPLERQRLEREVQNLKAENKNLKQILNNIFSESSKIVTYAE